jgi:hypothetical protein
MRKSSAFSHARRLAVSAVVPAARSGAETDQAGAFGAFSSMIFSRFSAIGDARPC